MAEAPLARVPRETLESLVREAARAPSLYNTQPARWRFEPGGDVVLFRALDRTLPVADSPGHDTDASLGAAFEGMAIALSRMSLRLGPPLPERVAQAEGCAPVVRARISTGGVEDPLAPQVMRRRTWRGRFTRRGARELAAARSVAAGDVHVIDDALDIRLASRSHDAAAWRLASRRDHHAEWWAWLRLSRRNPRYRRDGLDADCLAMSTVSRLAAMVLLRPRIFSALVPLRLARPLVRERSGIRSAIALLLFMPLRNDSAFDAGRRFYRLWLELTAAGLHAAPMSASAKDPRARAQYDALVPSDRRLVAVLRVGHVGADRVPESSRLPVAELLV